MRGLCRQQHPSHSWPSTLDNFKGNAALVAILHAVLSASVHFKKCNREDFERTLVFYGKRFGDKRMAGAVSLRTMIYISFHSDSHHFTSIFSSSCACVYPHTSLS